MKKEKEEKEEKGEREEERRVYLFIYLLIYFPSSAHCLFSVNFFVFGCGLRYFEE